MSALVVHIARAGAEFATCPAAEVPARLAAGEFRPTDHYWSPGMAAWRRLAEFAPAGRRLPFPRPVPDAPNLLDGMFGREHRTAGLARFWDLLAAMPAGGTIDEEAVRRIEEETGVRVRTRCAKELADWYQAMVAAALSDRVFTPEEKTDLASLAWRFGYDTAQAQAMHRTAFTAYFRAGLATALARDVPPDQRARSIAALSEQVPLPATEVAALVREALQEHLTQALQAVIERDDGRELVAPAQARGLRALALAMGQDLERDHAELAVRLERAERGWQVARGEMTPVATDLVLGSAEVCYWSRRVDLIQNKRVTVRRSYGGFAGSTGSILGVRYRTGSYQVARQTEDQMVQVDSGTALFTSSRVVFDGALKNFNFKLGKVIDVMEFSNGVGISRDSGPDVYFCFGADGHEAAAILRRLVREAKG